MTSLNHLLINKLKRKQCDILVANNVSEKNVGFNSDYNKVIILEKNGSITKIKKNKKSFIANKIINKIIDKLTKNKNVN